MNNCSYLNPAEVYTALNRALCLSREWANQQSKSSNSLRSARFVSDACEELKPLVEEARPHCSLKRRRIRVDGEGKRHGGEWLLDVTWTEDRKPDTRMQDPTPVRIRCALECESSTAGHEYFIDFAKLLVVRSDIKIFLGGLSQGTPEGAEDYVNTRVMQSQELLKSLQIEESSTDWHLAFWPSTRNVEGPKDGENRSLWNMLDKPKYEHLNKVRLFHWRDGNFERVEPRQQPEEGAL